MIEKDRIDTPLIVTLAVMASLLLFTLVVLLGALHDQSQSTLQRDRSERALPSELDVAAAEQRQRLERYAWIDREAGAVAVPIDRAVELVLRDYAAAAPGGGAQ